MNGRKDTSSFSGIFISDAAFEKALICEAIERGEKLYKIRLFFPLGCGLPECRAILAVFAIEEWIPVVKVIPCDGEGDFRLIIICASSFPRKVLAQGLRRRTGAKVDVGEITSEAFEAEAEGWEKEKDGDGGRRKESSEWERLSSLVLEYLALRCRLEGMLGIVETPGAALRNSTVKDAFAIKLGGHTSRKMPLLFFKREGELCAVPEYAISRAIFLGAEEDLKPINGGARGQVEPKSLPAFGIELRRVKGNLPGRGEIVLADEFLCIKEFALDTLKLLKTEGSSSYRARARGEDFLLLLPEEWEQRRAS